MQGSGKVRTAQRVREHNADLRRIDGFSETRRKQRYPEDEDITKKIQTDAKPSGDCDRHVVSSVFPV